MILFNPPRYFSKQFRILTHAHSISGLHRSRPAKLFTLGYVAVIFLNARGELLGLLLTIFFTKNKLLDYKISVHSKLRIAITTVKP